MSTVSESPPADAPAFPGGWRMHLLGPVDSTNTFAGRLPAWTAVRARTQTGGRGRVANRRWTSDEGGLWLSAVLPCPGPRARWETLPLAAGWAVLAALRARGVANLRLRWPNDLMVGRRKLAGLLVERFRADTAVIGLGLNVFNQPELAAPALAGHTVRLADLVPGNYTVDDLAQTILAALGDMHALLLDRGFAPIADQLNRDWGQPRQVAITINGRASSFTGLFQGVDPQGRLRILTEPDGPRVYDATQVALLRELA